MKAKLKGTTMCLREESTHAHKPEIKHMNSNTSRGSNIHKLIDYDTENVTDGYIQVHFNYNKNLNVYSPCFSLPSGIFAI